MDIAISRVTEMSKTIVAIDPPVLGEVSENDRPLVTNVLYAIIAFKHPERLCVSWSVSCTPTHYIVCGVLQDGDFDVELKDLQIIQSVNMWRISYVGISRLQEKNKIIVKVFNEKQKVAVTESDMFITHKKRKLFPVP
jgi:hypothetical protein